MPSNSIVPLGEVPAIHQKLGEMLSGRLVKLSKSLEYMDALEQRLTRDVGSPESMTLDQAYSIYKLISARNMEMMEILRKFALHELLPQFEAAEIYQYLMTLNPAERAALRDMVGSIKATSVIEVETMPAQQVREVVDDMQQKLQGL